MISVFTPVYIKSKPFLRDAYNSLVDQTFQDWEWVIILNGGGSVPDDISVDDRVKMFTVEDDDPTHNKIGRLKNYCCSKSIGDVLVELDSDDMLTEDCLSEISAAFENPDTMMVYSNSASFDTNTWESKKYTEYWGWRSREFEYKGHMLNEMIAWDPQPQAGRFIFWSPNHVRSWRKTAYDIVGGHDKSIKTGDDHDLCCRFYIEYGAKGLKHIDKCLYIYRTHSENSCVTNNKEVQIQTVKNYIRYNRRMTIKCAKDNGLRMLDLGGRINSWKDFETVDLMNSDIIMDLNKNWEFEDNSVGVIRASHVFEHLVNPIHTMNELYRVLAPGGWAFIEVPSSPSKGAFQDPTHVSYWNSNSFWYYTNRNYSRYIPAYKGRFQVSRLITYFPTEFERKNDIPIVQCDLIALKGWYSDRPVGEVLI